MKLVIFSLRIANLSHAYFCLPIIKLPKSIDFMNFLAHLLLSIHDEQIMVGNFIGDFVKGKNMSPFDEKIQKGIRLHRAIDSFTDQHPVVLESKLKLRPKFGHYAPVIVDVFYDHFIARDWNKFSSEPLLDFTLRFYSLMQNYKSKIPNAVNTMLMHMSKGNWLYNYRHLDGINTTLEGISRRTSFDSKMEMATEMLQLHYSEFDKEFYKFFPDLQAYTNNFDK